MARDLLQQSVRRSKIVAWLAAMVAAALVCPSSAGAAERSERSVLDRAGTIIAGEEMPRDDGSRGRGWPAAATQAVNISAQVDKTTVNLGTQVTLTITVEGDLDHVDLKEWKFPDALPVVAQSRASNVSIGQGQVTKSVSLIFVLVPQEAGTFTLGPFEASHLSTDVSTQPIEITVKKPVVPPTQAHTQRYTL